MFVYVFVYMCMSVCVCAYICVYMCDMLACMCVYMYVSGCRFLSLPDTSPHLVLGCSKASSLEWPFLCGHLLSSLHRHLVSIIHPQGQAVDIH